VAGRTIHFTSGHLDAIKHFKCTAASLEGCLMCDKDQFGSKPFQFVCLLCKKGKKMNRAGECKEGETPDPPKPEPPKPDPGKGCKDYHSELRCYKPLHPEPFSYNLFLRISNISFNDVPHLQFVIKEIDSLDLALRNSLKGIAEIKVSSIVPSYESEPAKRRILDSSSSRYFPASCKQVLPP
jgi:hypothetical protein